MRLFDPEDQSVLDQPVGDGGGELEVDGELLGCDAVWRPVRVWTDPMSLYSARLAFAS